jgi:hypothetical protein
LLPPVPPSRERMQQIEQSPVKIYQENSAGRMVELNVLGRRDLWSR